MSVPPADSRPALITGGAGFVGCNIADRLARQGRTVLVYDSLARPHVGENLAWLQDRHGEKIVSIVADVRDKAALRDAVSGVSEVYHFAAQVAVTTSLDDPETDFEVNARGTFNLLEVIRAQRQPPPLVFASTNKVYGHLPDLELRETNRRYEPTDPELAANGVSEKASLCFYSPYGCSKGTADQYVLDYARCYGLPTAVFRMSCLYGPRQFGTEDQGWVAHFVLSALTGQPVTIYGDGKQVRDILFIEDAVDAYLLAQKHMAQIRGQAFNLGGGPPNSVSLIEILDLIAKLGRRAPQLSHGPWRAGDQRYYVSDTRKLASATGWRAAVGPEMGVRRLFKWLQEWAEPKPAKAASQRIPA